MMPPIVAAPASLSLSSLSRNDALQLLEIIQLCLSATDQSDINGCVFPRIQNVIPYDFAGACLVGRDPSPCKIKLRHSFVGTMPAEYGREYNRAYHFKGDTVAHENFRSFQPQYWSARHSVHLLARSDERKPLSISKPTLSLMTDFGIRGGFTAGCPPTAKDGNGSFFYFLGRNIDFEPRVLAILEYLSPHLHQALLRCAGDAPPGTALDAVSGREKQVLEWLKEGKSSWDISTILGIRERTVNFHVSNIVRKLGAQNRSQAVAIALQSRLISLD